MKIQLIRLSIYLLPFQVFGFAQGGFGTVEPAAIPLIILIILSFVQSGFQPLKAFGQKQQIYSILLFLILTIIGTIFSFLFDKYDSYYRSIGVLVSLIFLLLIYYVISATIKSPIESKQLCQDFLKVSIFICFTVILEYLIVLLTGVNSWRIILNSIGGGLPYPSIYAGYLDGYYSSVLLYDQDRFQGILREPADVGIYVIPALAIIIQALLLGILKKGKKFLAILSIILILWATMLTYSVTNFFMMFVLLLYFTFTAKKVREILNKNIFKTFVSTFYVLSIFIVVALIMFIFRDTFPEIIADRLNDLYSFWESGKLLNPFQLTNSDIDISNLSVGTILNSYSTAIYALQNNPFVGLGLGNFVLGFQSAAPFQEGILGILCRHDGYSMLSRLLVECGIVGTICFIWIFWSRANQIRDFFTRIILIENPLLRKHYLYLAKIGLAISVGAMSELGFLMLNRPSYWNVVFPLLFGICFKSNLSFFYFDRGKDINKIAVTKTDEARNY
ncbi:MAG: hypothetical protein GPI93_11890 [Microcystis aeruginosa LG13-12]|jgi:hypothetical protein|nr:hypothetical protein [Microcystis aeruginosa LG13-12]